MARKKKQEPHENLERWLVSYADFITLLFATFVVLYALSQVDVSKFPELGASLRDSFTSSVFDGTKGVMSENGEKIIGESQADAMMSSLILEYLNPKYEEHAFDEIKKDIEEMQKNQELDGINVKIDDRGLVIMLSEKALLFPSGSADLSAQGKKELEKIGAVIGKRFILHLMRIEGHTDSQPSSNAKFPSNWELSAARACAIVRFLIQRFDFAPELFTPIGYADTRPMASNATPQGRSQNRRVDIVVLRNKYKTVEDARDSLIKMDKKEQTKIQEKHRNTINKILGLSDAAKQLTTEKDDGKKIIILKERINRSRF